MNFLLPEEESRLSQPADTAAADQPAPTTFLLPDEQPVEQRATTTLRNVLPINPDKAGEARRIANNTGIAEQVVDRNFDQAKNESRLRDLQSALASSPILARQLTDPSFAKLAHDDVENLLGVTGTIGPVTGPKPSMGSIIGGLFSSLGQGAEGARQGLRQQFADVLGFEGMSKDAGRKASTNRLERDLSTPEFESSTARGVYGGLSSVIQQAPGIAASIATGSPAPMLAMMGVQSEAEAYTKYRARGASPVLAGVGALGEGATEVLTEMVPMSFLVGKLGKVGAGEFLTGLLAREIPSEQVATLVQDAIDTAVANPDKTWAQYAKERPGAAYETFVATVTQAGVMAGTGAAVKRLNDQRPEMAEHNAVALEQLVKLSEASKVRERDTSSFQSFVDAAAEEGPVQNIHVSAATFMQAAGENLGALSEAMPSVKEQMAEAIASGGELVIPLGEFAAHIPGTGMDTALIDHIRTAPDAMTRDEAKTFMQSGQEQFQAEATKILEEKEFDTAFKESSASVERELLTQLNTANRFTDDVNKPYAQLASAFYTVQAARLGITPEQMYVKYPLQITADGLGASSMDQSPFTNNASGESSASVEAINRLNSENAAGKQYFKIDSGTNSVVPLVTADRVDAQAKGKEIIVRHEGNGKYTVLNMGDGLPRTAAEGAINRAMSKLQNTLNQSVDEYGGDHRPPGPDGGAPLHDLTGGGNIYPDDVYGPRAAQYYGHGDERLDRHTVAIAQSFKGKPNAKVKIYRAIPDTLTNADKLAKLEKQMAKYQARNTVPEGEEPKGWYDRAYDERERLRNLPPEPDAAKVAINAGDWVTINRDYAVEHGESTLNGNYKIITKTVKASEIFTNGDSIHEWGYWPAGTYEQSQPDGARAQISFAEDITQTPSVISLLQNADLSSFVHELGHFQLEVLAHISSQPEAPAEIRADMDALLKWFAVPGTGGPERLMNWNMLSLGEKRPMHEQLARGFEAYLFEGNAPSVELQGVFSRIRAWMMHVYQSLSKLNITLTDEVRGVFDRLLATNDDILTAEAARGYSPLFQSAEEMGATQAEWKAYQELNQGQAQEAVDQLGSRSLRDMRWVTNTRAKVMKALQRDANTKRKAVKAEVAAEVRQQPVYSAQHFLKTGEMTGPDGEQIKIEKGAKLDNAALSEMYPETMLARPDMTNLQGMTRDDGLHPDIVAQMFGFTSGDHLVRDLLAAEPESVHVDAVTNQRMLERYGDLSSPEAISRATDEAIHNEARGRFLVTEANALAKAIGQTRMLGKAAKAFATQIIARKKIRDVKPAQYSAAEARAGKAAEKAKSLVEKATEKRNQIVNHHAARAAYEALSDVEKGLTRFKRLDGNLSIDIGYRDQIDQLLERFDLRSGQTLKAIDKRTALADWITSQEAMGFEPTISDELRNEAFRKSYKDMTVEEFRGLVDAVKNIEHLGRLKKKLLTAKDDREFHAAVEDIATTIKENAKKTLPEQRATDRGFLVKMGSLFRTAVAMHRKFASLVRGFDGYKDGGVAWEYLVRNMNERGNFEAVENEKATIALTKLLSPVMKAGKLTQKQFFPDSGKSFTREERIGIALNMGNETNRERVLSGENLDPEQLTSILDTLTKEDWNFVQGVWGYFETFRPQIAAKERRITGVEPEWVEPSPVNTIHGEYKGGYFPIAYDPIRSERSNADVNAEVARQMQQGLYARAQTRRGHTKARSDSTGRPLRYDFGEVITRHVTQVVHDLAWHEYLIDANRLLRSGEVENAVRDHYGVEVLQELKDTLRDIAVGTAAIDKGAAFFNHLRFGTTIVGLAYNVFNTLQNLTGITQSMSRIGTKWVMKGAAHWAGDAVRFEGSIKQIHEMSDFMRLRAKTMQREINDIRNKVSGEDSKLKASFFYLQQKTQLMVDVPTWWGAYEKAMSEDDMTQDKAVALADQAVLDAQGSGQTKDLAGIMRGGAGLKLLTTFYNFFNTTFNLTAEAAGRTDFKKPGQVALFAADMVLLYTLPSLLTTLLRAAMMGDWEDEDKLAKKIVSDMIGFALGTIIGLREASAGVQAAVGVGEGFGYTGPASLRFFSDIYKLGQQINQGEADEAFWKALNNVGGVLFHYPAGQLNRTASGFNALLDGRTQNPLALVMGAPPKK